MNDEDQTGALTILIGVFSGDRYTGRMINLILLTLTLANPQAPVPAATAQFRPCVWPNTCKAAAAPVVAQFTTCVWPNRCGKKPAQASFTL